MKKLARLLGVLGGMAAVVWAMRDRLVSIAAPREPEPPRFRVVPPMPRQPATAPPGGDDLTAINGIGPVFAARLRSAGIERFSDLAQADPERIAEAAGVPVARVEDWISQAGSRTG